MCVTIQKTPSDVGFFCLTKLQEIATAERTLTYFLPLGIHTTTNANNKLPSELHEQCWFFLATQLHQSFIPHVYSYTLHVAGTDEHTDMSETAEMMVMF